MPSRAKLLHASVPAIQTLDSVAADPAPRPEPVSVEQIEAYYDKKTLSLLHRYGPGPRVHYHSGIVARPYNPTGSFAALKGNIHRSQEHLMTRLAQLWDARTNLCGDVLDVGCGLGGGSLFWAQEFGATVTAVTCAPSHISWIAKFAKQGGVHHLVRPLLSDAVQVPGDNCFDAAVAIESSCHMPRRPLFQRLASLLRPGGRIFIEDYFTNKQEITDLFHRHWESPLGSREEYREAGEEAGLRLESVDDLTETLAPYWSLSAALLKAEVKRQILNSAEREKHTRSLAVHTKVGQAMWTHDIEALALSFRKP
jgi:cyclopropane fatty-acyl-phospholipid synthase-like methyltransferase